MATISTSRSLVERVAKSGGRDKNIRRLAIPRPAPTPDAYLGTRPSRRKIVRLCQAIHAMTSRSMVWADIDDRIVRLNRLLTGWANYFCLGSVKKAYLLVDKYACYRLRHWLRAKHNLQGEEKSRFPDPYLERQLGLARLQRRRRSFPWANA
jgi:RNA-directed DNA polymerase